MISTVTEFAHSIAANIERFGHFRGYPSYKYTSLNSTQNPYGLCCIIANPTTGALSLHDDEGHDLRSRFESALEAKIYQSGTDVDFVTWSDVTPTSEVLATLRSL